MNPDAAVAARLVAADPSAFGGLVLRGDHAATLDALRAALPPGAPVRRLPLTVDDERLLGGLDLAATLAHGARVESAGLLAEAEGGLVVAPLAERLNPAVAGRLAQALDGEGGFALVALDTSSDGESVPPALTERLAFYVDCDRTEPLPEDDAPVAHDEALDALTEAAAALGIASMRPVLFAWRAAEALAGAGALHRGHLAIAARLVLAPRATTVPPGDSAPDREEGGESESEADGGESLSDVILAAARAALPPGLFAAPGRAPARKGLSGSPRGGGNRLRGAVRGRVIGARAGLPRGGARLALVETLRAAAPWQRLRGRSDRVLICRDDLRIARVEARAGVTTIMAVDASGSAALARLAEAKGAVELMLSRAYVDRAEVALIAFRGTGAELLLPPTRSLTRARRALAELPGGGGTPLAAGLAAAGELARRVRSRGRTPRLAVLTDGRANIALDGRADRTVAQADAAAAARRLQADGLTSVLIDIAARPRPEGALLAKAMGARYLALPRAEASALSDAIAQG